jgi:hypothetical protein
MIGSLHRANCVYASLFDIENVELEVHLRKEKRMVRTTRPAANIAMIVPSNRMTRHDSNRRDLTHWLKVFALRLEKSHVTITAHMRDTYFGQQGESGFF